MQIKLLLIKTIRLAFQIEMKKAFVMFNNTERHANSLLMQCWAVCVCVVCVEKIHFRLMFIPASSEVLRRF